MDNFKLLMIPGPTPVVRSIQDEMGRETIAFGDKRFVDDFRSVLDDLKALWNCDGKVFVVAATGTYAMEMAVANNVFLEDQVLIVSNGFFGDRFKDIVERKGISYEVLSAKWGETATVEEIDQKLSQGKFTAITVSHVDTSTGVVAPIKEIGEMLKKKYPDIIYIVDGVCSAAGERVYLTDMNIDVFFTGSQKAFGVCPGLSILWANQKSLDKRGTKDTIPEYYCDYKKWEPVMDDTSKYFATPAINLIWALKKSLAIIKEEGIENRYTRHRETADAMQAAFESMGFTLLAKEGCRAATLSNLLYPEGVTDGQFRSELEKEGVQVAGGLGEYAGKMFRVGHMGNVNQHDLIAVLGDIERVLYRLKDGYKLGIGVTTYLEKSTKK